MKKILQTVIILLLAMNVFAQKSNTGLALRTNGLALELTYELGLGDKSSLLFGAGLGPFVFMDKSNFGAQRQSGSFELGNVAWAPFLNVEYRNYFMKKAPPHSGLFFGGKLKMNAEESDWISSKHASERINATYKVGATFGFKWHFGNSPIFVDTQTGLAVLGNLEGAGMEFWPLFDAKIGILLWRK